MISLSSVARENIFSSPFDVSWFHKPVIRKLLAILQSEGAEVFAVGGCVRDAFWRKDVREIDLAINIEPKRVKDLVNKIDCKVLKAGLEYGTVAVILEGQKFEITSFRKDIKTFGRKAKVQYTDDLKEDAKRRDFTFNAIYLKPNGLIIDPLGGFSDLRSGKVKFVGDANKRIDEDHLRILRYFRFVSKFPSANKNPDQEILDAISIKRSLILKLSRERIWNELKLILSSHSVTTAMFLMDQTGVLPILFPKANLDELTKMSNLEKLLEEIVQDSDELKNLIFSDPIRRLALLSAENDISNQVCLSLGKQEMKRLRFYQLKACNLSEESYHMIGFKYDLQTSMDLLLWNMTKGKKYTSLELKKNSISILRSCCKKMVEGSSAKFPLSGEDLLNRGYSGKKLGLTLKEMETVWIASGFSLSKSQLLEKI